MATTELARLRRELAKAKRRAWYWSGNPSFTRKSFSPSRSRALLGDPDISYEVTMCDVMALQRAVEAAGGEPQKPFDPRADFRKRWGEMMTKLAREPNS